MLNYLIITILSFLFASFLIMFVAILKVCTMCDKNEKKEDFGQIAYNELEKREKESEINE